MTFDALLVDLGVNVAANAIYDVARAYFRSTKSPTTEGLRDALAASLKLQNARVVADKLVEFMAKNGNITITGSTILAKSQITMASFAGTTVTFGDGSESTTSKTSIQAGQGAQITMQGGARIVQDDDGSIKFQV